MLKITSKQTGMHQRSCIISTAGLMDVCGMLNICFKLEVYIKCMVEIGKCSRICNVLGN